jgi:F-type H+-transporting ATPase subunit alpha
VTAGVFDNIEIDQVDEAETTIRKTLLQQLPDVSHRIEMGEQLSNDDKESILKMAKDTVTFHYGIV